MKIPSQHVFLTLFFFCLQGVLMAGDYLSSGRLVLDTDAFYYTNGTVGMGTTTPLGVLDIAKNNRTDYLLTFMNTHTSTAATGFGFYAGAMTSLANGALALRRINSLTSSTNIMVFASKNIGIGTFAEPPNFSDLPDKGKLQVKGNVYVGPTPGNPLGGFIQSADGTGAVYLTPNKEKISFGYDMVTKHFKILIDGQAILFGRNGGTAKTFVVSHPNNPMLHLVHAMQELPENTVQYVGTAHLKNGQATITLPSYFEALTRQEGRYIRLSHVDGFDVLKIKPQSEKKIHKGRFVVISNNPKSNQTFDWEVTAVRSDVPTLNPTPLRTQVQIKGRPPYTYIETSL